MSRKAFSYRHHPRRSAGGDSPALPIPERRPNTRSSSTRAWNLSGRNGHYHPGDRLLRRRAHFPFHAGGADLRQLSGRRWGPTPNDYAGSPNQSRPLDLAPIYRVLSGTDNRKEYRIAVPDMDAAEARNASIAPNALVTLTLLSNAGFTNPTESGSDDFTVSTSDSPMTVERKFTTPVQLFSDDKADNRNKPLTITGKGFKNGTSATVYLDRNRNGKKDAGDVDLITVPVADRRHLHEATFNVTVPPFEALPYKNVINAVDGEAPVNTLKWAAPTYDTEADGLVDGPRNRRRRRRWPRGRRPTTTSSSRPLWQQKPPSSRSRGYCLSPPRPWGLATP